MTFNYGAKPTEIKGGSFKTASEGSHNALVRSIIHCGMFQEEFQGKKKEIAPQVVVIFELKNKKDVEEDGVTPLVMSASFALRKGDKATLTKFCTVLNKQGAATGFDDYIGRHISIDIKGNPRHLNDDGSFKYVNIRGYGEVHEEMADSLKPMAVAGVGHVTFEQMTKEAIMELNPLLEVANIIEKGVNYSGSPAEEIIKTIRVDNPTFGKPRAKAGEGSPEIKGTNSAPVVAASAPDALSEDEDF